jgi:phosphatidylglycerophosphate synthase
MDQKIQEIKQRTKSWWKRNLANVATVIGILSSLYFIWTALTEPENLLKISISAIIAGITDFIDGHIAREFKIESVFGSYIDRLRDRLLIYPGMVILGVQYWEKITFPGIAIVLLFFLACLEFFIVRIGIIGLRWHLKGKDLNLKVSEYGKKKVFAGFMIVFIFIASLNFESLGTSFLRYSIWLIYTGLGLMVYWAYVSWREYQDREREERIKDAKESSE